VAQPLSLFLLTLALLSCPAPAQSIEGHVALPKTHTAPVVTKRYEIVTKGGVVATNPPLAVVYLEGNFPRSSSLPTKQVEQKNLTFVPALLPVQVGTRVEFPNQDDTYHNIFSYSPAKRFDLGRYRPEERPIPSQVFDQPGLITLRCDIHEHMRGLILVLATPHFTMSDASGHFKLSGLPAGHYTLKAWVSSKSTLEKAIDLKAGQELKVDLP
jgi:plastocyanin